MGMFLLFLLFIGVLYSYVKNKDLFSPSKWYFLYIFYFFKNIFFREYSIEIYVIYFLLIFLGFVFVSLESKATKHSMVAVYKKEKLINQNQIFIFLLLLSILPIITQWNFVKSYGNIFEYINGISLRVKEWKGKGALQALIKLLPLINIIYLILIFAYKVQKKWIYIYIVHLGIVVFFGLLSGSRGSSLFVILNVLVIYNYYHKRLIIAKIAPIIVAFFLVAAVLSIVRNQVKSDGQEIVFYDKDSFKDNLASDHESYGLIGLKGVYGKEYSDLEYGLTFFTVVTNFVPRYFWPSKPSSGGVLITKHIDGRMYTGTSNYSTGIYAESIMNFGYIAGPLFATILMIILGNKIIKYYNTFISKREMFSVKKIIFTTFLLLQFQRIIGGITLGEFTNLFFAMIRDIFFIYTIFFLMKLFKVKLK